MPMHVTFTAMIKRTHYTLLHYPGTRVMLVALGFNINRHSSER